MGPILAIGGGRQEPLPPGLPLHTEAGGLEPIEVEGGKSREKHCTPGVGGDGIDRPGLKEQVIAKPSAAFQYIASIRDDIPPLSGSRAVDAE